MSKRIKIIFTLSLLLNILFLGVAGGMAFKFSERFDRGGFKEKLGPEARAFLQEKMQEDQGERRARMQEMRQLKQEMAGIVRADPFDREVFLEKAQVLQAIQGKFASKRFEVMADLAERMDAEEREGIAQRLERKHHFKGRSGER